MMNRKPAGLLLLLLFVCTTALFGQNPPPPPNPVPVLVSITPAILAPAASDFTVTLNGSGFINTQTSASVVSFNGTAITTIVDSSTSIRATIPGALLQNANGAVPITVFNDVPGGGTSAADFLYVIPAFGLLPLPQTRYIPHIVSGAGYATKIVVTDTSSAPNAFVVSYWTQNGQQVRLDGGIIHQDSYALAANASVKIAMPDSVRSQDSFIQWATIQSNGNVLVTLNFDLADPSGRMVNAVGTQAVSQLVDTHLVPLPAADPKVTQNFVIPVEFEPNPNPQLQPAGRTIGLAMANTTGTPANVNLTLFDANGTRIATTFLLIPGNGQQSVDLGILLSTLLPASNFVGIVAVNTTQPVAPIAIEGDLGLFYFIPISQGFPH